MTYRVFHRITDGYGGVKEHFRDFTYHKQAQEYYDEQRISNRVLGHRIVDMHSGNVLESKGNNLYD